MTKARRGPQRNRPRKRPAAATPKAGDPKEVVSGWARLSRGTRALVAVVATTAVAAVVPGVIPYVSDRVLDLIGVDLVDIDTAFGPDHGLYAAAMRPLAAQPADVLHDPQFIPAGYSATKLTLEGKRAGIAVVGLTAEVLERRPPRTGTLYGVQSQGEADNTAVAVNLDAPKPVALTADRGTPFFDAKHIDLARGELHVIHIESSTTRCECAWRLHLVLRYRGKQREIVLPAAGRPPFRMTAFPARPADYAVQYVWNDKGIIVRHDCAAERKTCAATYLPPVVRR